MPEYLRSYATIAKTAVIAGLYNRLEIWDEAKWETYKHQVETDADSVAEKLGELGI